MENKIKIKRTKLIEKQITQVFETIQNRNSTTYTTDLDGKKLSITLFKDRDNKDKAIIWLDKVRLNGNYKNFDIVDNKLHRAAFGVMKNIVTGAVAYEIMNIANALVENLSKQTTEDEEDETVYDDMEVEL